MSLIARGGMGEVFAAADQSSGARVALKRMLSQHGKQATHTVHFMREFHALSGLRHPRIIEVYDYGVDDERPYYTMELLDGQDLRELSPVPYREACAYLRDVASSLALLHARRLLHRDISPRNVRRTSDRRCKLLDFGAMVPFGVPPNLIGTPPCIPPEALQGGSLDQRSDLYSLGALAYFLLTGRYSHPATDIASLPDAWLQPLLRPSAIVADVPGALDDLVLALLSMDALQRPASAAEVIERLSGVGELEPQDDAAAARSFLTGSQLFGRNAQRERVRGHVVKSLTGHGAAVLICGESGMGRSRMLAEAALIGQVHGASVIRMAARSSTTPFVLATDLIQGLSQAAPVEVERASAKHAGILSRARAAESGDDHSQLLQALSELVRAAAKARPLLITVDDLERADELSNALVAALAHQSSECALSVVASFDQRHEAPVLARVADLAETITLRPLDRGQTIMLAVSLFGDVPNVERLGDWLYRVAAGNPKLTLELAEHLFARGAVRYVGGMWVLPAELAEALPPSAADALLLRLSGVSGDARALAELLSVSRMGASAERILELANKPPALIFGALDELVRAGILESAGSAYAFAQDAMHESLRDALDPEQRKTLHAAWAERLLASDRSADAQLEAGLHLAHTHDELRGADIMARVAPDMVERRLNMAAAVPALERALEIYARHGRPLAEQLRLRSLLVMSSFLFDHRLAKRHADAALNGLYPFTGLQLVQRFSRILGRRMAFALGLATSGLRWLFRRRADRGPNVVDAIRYYARAAMGLVGLRALAIDVEGVRAAFERMRTFEGSPHPTLALLHTLAKAVSLHNEGRGVDMKPLVQEVLDRLSSDYGSPMQMSQVERTDLLTGALLLQGLDECYREHSKALRYAEHLDQLNTPIARAAALRINMSYHLLRGATEETQYYRRLLDLSAIQNGTVWQIEWVAVPLEGIAGYTWSDLVMVRRALDALDRMAAEEPGFEGMRDMVRIGYHFRRGDNAAAVRFGEAYIKAHPPFTLLGWAATYGMVALAHLELGNAVRALEITEPATALLTSRHHPYIYHYTGFEAAHATVLAVSGQRERGESLFRALVERLRASGEHARVFLMHEYRVRQARLLGDSGALHVALRAMREAALDSGNSSAMLLATAVYERTMRTQHPPPPAAAKPARSELPLVGAFLQGDAQRALYMLSQYANGGECYLYWLKGGKLELAASLDRREPPATLERVLSALPINDVERPRDLTLSQTSVSGYTVVRLVDSADSCVALAALRGVRSGDIAIPSALISDIGRALSAGSRDPT
ncbi:MAG TPA: AAA family ATPase [Polyangiales bacterium]|nr:AAA family ATPase [Polyangiales bacterium]